MKNKKGKTNRDPNNYVNMRVPPYMMVGCVHKQQNDTKNEFQEERNICRHRNKQLPSYPRCTLCFIIWEEPKEATSMGLVTYWMIHEWRYLCFLAGGIYEYQLLYKCALGVSLCLLVEFNEERYAHGTHWGALHMLNRLHDPQHSWPYSTF